MRETIKVAEPQDRVTFDYTAWITKLVQNIKLTVHSNDTIC